MGCNCGGGRRSAPRNFRRKALKPSVGPTSVQGQAAGPSNAQLRALGLQKNLSQAVSVSETRRLDENRRQLEKKRRDAIRRRLNK
jgi:hypothetical protein